MAKVAMITGGAGGIGSATARLLWQKGYSLVLLGRDADKLERIGAELGEANRLKLFAADVTDPEQAAQAVEGAFEWKHRLDAIIHTAGYAPHLTLAQTTPADWRDIVDCNLSSAMYLVHSAWPKFVAQQKRAADLPGFSGASIVLISSEASRDPFPGLGAYAAAKIGLNMLAKIMAREGQSLGLKAFCVAPAATDTPMLRSLPYADKIPASQILHTEDVACTIVDALEGGLANSSGETIFVHRGAR